MLGDFSVCLVSVGARSAAGSGGTSAVGDLAGEVGGVVLGEGEKSGCEGGGGEAAGEVGVGEGVGSCCCGSACGGLVVGPVNVEGLGALSSGLGTARRRSQRGEQQTPNWDGVEDCL